MQPATGQCRLHLHGHHERIVLMESCNYEHTFVDIWQPSTRAWGDPAHNLTTLVGNAFDSLAPDKHFHASHTCPHFFFADPQHI